MQPNPHTCTMFLCHPRVASRASRWYFLSNTAALGGFCRLVCRPCSYVYPPVTYYQQLYRLSDFHKILYVSIGGRGGGELNTRIIRIQKRVIISMVGISSKTSCIQQNWIFSLWLWYIHTYIYIYILEVICLIWKYRQSVELNSNVHIYNTRSKMDVHIKSYNTEIYKKRNKHED